MAEAVEKVTAPVDEQAQVEEKETFEPDCNCDIAEDEKECSCEECDHNGGYAPTIQIMYNNGTGAYWEPGTFTSYTYNGKSFMVFRGEALVGLYNFDAVASVEVR